MKYYVTDIQGMQYRVTEGQELDVNKINGETGDTIKFDKVLLSVDGDKVKIGDPYIKGLEITAKILKQFKDDKVIVGKFRAKTGYRRRLGFRAQKTTIKIETLN